MALDQGVGRADRRRTSECIDPACWKPTIAANRLLHGRARVIQHAPRYSIGKGPIDSSDFGSADILASTQYQWVMCCICSAT